MNNSQYMDKLRRVVSADDPTQLYSRVGQIGKRRVSFLLLQC